MALDQEMNCSKTKSNGPPSVASSDSNGPPSRCGSCSTVSSFQTPCGDPGAEDATVLSTVRDILKERHAAILKALRTLDRRNTGRVLRSQLRQCFRTYCFPLSASQFNLLVPQDRVESDGKVDYARLLSDLSGVAASVRQSESPLVEMRPMTLDQLEYHLKLKIHENLKDILKGFFMYDVNHDGMVQKKEARRVLENYTFRIPDEQFNLLWHRYDPNHTGLICYEDFLVRLGINAGRCQMFLPSHVMSRALCWSDRDVESFLDKARQKKRREYAAQENLDDPSIQGKTMNDVLTVFLKKLKRPDTRKRLEMACESLDTKATGAISDSQFHSLLNHLVMSMSPELYRQLMDATVPPRAPDIRKIDWKAFLDKFCRDSSSADAATAFSKRSPPAVLVQKAIDKLKLNVVTPQDRFQDIYTKIDQQGSRVATRSEARRALQTADFTLADEEWHALWNVLDPAHVNVIRVDDLLALLEPPQVHPANVNPPGTLRAQLNSQLVPTYRDIHLDISDDKTSRQHLSQLRGGVLLRKLKSLVTQHRSAIMKVLRGLDWLRCGTLDHKSIRRTIEEHAFPLTDEQWDEVLSHVEVHRDQVDYGLLMDSFMTGPGEETTRWLRDVGKLMSQAPKHRKVQLLEEEALETVRDGVRCHYNAMLHDLRQIDYCKTGCVAASDFRRVLNRHVVRLSDAHFERLWTEGPLDTRGRLQYLDWLSKWGPQSCQPSPEHRHADPPEVHRDVEVAREAPVELVPGPCRVSPRHLSGAGVCRDVKPWYTDDNLPRRLQTRRAF